MLNKVKLLFFSILSVLLSACLLLACSGAPESNELVVIEGDTMGTRYQVKLVAVPDGVNITQLETSIHQVLEDINQEMSTYRLDSTLSLFNQAEPRTWYPVSADILAVVKLAQEISEMSQGAFDITVGPLVNMWGFGPNKKAIQVPSQEQIDAIKLNMGYQNLKLQASPPALLKEAELKIDLSAIAKGYAVDKLVELVERQSINNYLVEIGGELKAKGKNQRGLIWRIGIEIPDGGIRDALKSLSVDNIAVATSGDYRNYFEQDGQRYSHTIDPNTGYPITHNLASVTVVAQTTAKADALATAFNVLGEEKAYSLAVENNIPAFFVIKDNTDNNQIIFREKMTPLMQKYINQ